MKTKDLVHRGMVIENMMENTYLPSKGIQKKTLIVPDDILDRLKNELNDRNIYISDDGILKKIVGDIIKGNIILQGPPGTGKSVMAEAICEAFNVVPIVITAVDDWTTYDTIGGLAPAVEDKREIIVGKNGRIVEAIIRCCNEMLLEEAGEKDAKQAAWIIIDELNRSEIDKVFGDLFTIMGSNDPTEKHLSLWFQNDVDKKTLYVPNRFRIIGTMNNADKNFVNDLSQALSRRFSINTIMPPALNYIDEEIDIIKKGVKERIKYKISNMDDKKIDSIYSNSAFKKCENDIKELITHLRYTGDNSSGDNSLFAGIYTGSAQIKDLYETVLIGLYLEGATITEDSIKEAFDRGVESELIPQLKTAKFDQKIRFINYFDEACKKTLAWMKYTKQALDTI